LKNLVLNSIILIFLGSGCSLNRYTSYKPPEPVNEILFKLTDDGESAFFNAQVKYPGNHMSGVLVLQPGLTGSNRIVLLTVFGMKVFDIELTANNEMLVHYVMEPLNRKSVLNAFNDLLGLLVFDFNNKELVKSLKNKNTGDLAYLMKDNKCRYLVVTNEENSSLKYIKRKDKIIQSVVMDVYHNDKFLPDSLVLSRKPPMLNIVLSRIYE